MTSIQNAQRRLESANTVPSPTSLPDGMWSSAELLERIHERNRTMTDSLTPIKLDPPSPDPNRRGPVVALAAAAMVIVIGVVAAFLAISNESDPVAPTTETTTTTAPTTTAPTTTAPSFGEVDALELVEDYFVAFANADRDRMVEIHDPRERTDAVQFCFGVPCVDGSFVSSFELSLDELYLLDTYRHAAGWQLTNPDCSVVEADPSGFISRIPEGAEVWVDCVHGELMGHEVLLGIEPFMVRSTFFVSSDGILSSYRRVGRPDYEDRSATFDRWISVNHPGSSRFGDYVSEDEARAGGERALELAQQWIAFLEANDCEPSDFSCGEDA